MMERDNIIINPSSDSLHEQIIWKNLSLWMVAN